MNRPHLIIAGQFPPPVNGFAYITQEMAKELAVDYATTIIDLAPHFPKNGIRYHLRRLFLTLKGVWPLLRGSVRKNCRFYVACEGGLGLVYTFMLCTMARMLRIPIYIHHHSFAYIERTSILMTCMLRLVGDRAITHIFLCPVMAQRFADRYRRPIKNLILSNSAFVGVENSTPRARQEGEPLVIGLLSNLSNEKGLGAFLEVLHRVTQEGLNIKGLLAGPPVSASDGDLIDNARQKLGGKLEYLGPVYGEEKTRFFRSLDVFVYPTKNDAQPMVVFEAMAHGIPVLTYDRGCIQDQVGVYGSVLERDGDFPPFALHWLKEHMASPQTLDELKCAVQAAFRQDRPLAKQKVSVLFELEPNVMRPSLQTE